MSLGRLILRGLAFYGRANLGVALGAAVAVAAIAGSLAVGDSIRASLRRTALERLGAVDHVLKSPGLFREDLASACQSQLPAGGVCAPAMMLKGAAQPPAEAASPGAPVSGVNVLGVCPDFWRAVGVAGRILDGRQALVNRPLADDLGLRPGDALILTVPAADAAPKNSFLGRRSRREVERRLRVLVEDVLPESGAGAFSMGRDSAAPRNVYVSLAWLQERLGTPARANTMLVSAPQADEKRLQAMVKSAANIEDYGLELRRVGPDKSCLQLDSGRVVLSDAVVGPAMEAAAEVGLTASRVSVYLFNSIRRADSNGEVPYSLVAAIDPAPAPLKATAPDRIVLNSWAAEDLSAKAGDVVEADYYVVAERGRLLTRRRRFVVEGVAVMQGAAADPDLAPRVPGVTDAAMMGEWDAPFPLDMDRVRPRDEEYWERHRATPKAFASPAALRDLWAEGGQAVADWVTAVRLYGQSPSEDFARALLRRLDPAEAGLSFAPVRREAIESSRGSTDYASLFLGMSAFIVAASAGLVALIVRLSVERRAAQAGIMLSVGLAERTVRNVLAAEAMIVALGGAGLGTALAVGYARLLVAALCAQWSAAVADFPVSLHVAWSSLVIGGLAGWLAAGVAVAWALRLLRRSDTVRLLRGWRAMLAEPRSGAARRARRAAAFMFGLGLFVAALAFADVVHRVTGFFAGGAVLLASGVAWVCAGLTDARPAAALSLWGLALRESRRHRGRTALTTGLAACATFVIVAVAANRRDFSAWDASSPTSGSGGFTLMARTTAPVYEDLASDSGRERLGLTADQAAALSRCEIVSFRVRDGDDVSCRNIRQVLTPRVLGAPDSLIRRTGVWWPDEASRKAWASLGGEGGSDNETPAIGDEASVRWVLGKGVGDAVAVPGSGGRLTTLRITGLLSQSVFQGELIVSERQFVEAFGAEDGYRCFLVRTGPGQEPRAAAALRSGLASLGVEVTRAGEALERFGRVQNAYLATFQTLGGLGLLLGSFGVVTVLLRNVWERRAELGLMMALGFRRGTLVGMVVAQNAVWLTVGVGIGAVAALLAVAPHLASAQADPPWAGLAATLGGVLAVGLVACGLAAISAVREDVLASLRSE